MLSITRSIDVNNDGERDEGNKDAIIGYKVDDHDRDDDGMMSPTPHLRKVRQFCPCQSFGSFLIQSYLNTNLALGSPFEDD